MSQLPKGWVGTTLIELANFIDYRGRTPKKTDSGIPLITAKNIKDGFINREPREYIAEGDYYDWMTRGFPKVGDVLLTTEAPLGNVAQIDIEEKFALAQRAICFQFYETGIERFIYYYLRSPLFNQELDLNSTGSTVKGIKAATLKKLPVHIAPLPEQKLIVEKLDEVLAQVDTIKARLDGIPDLLKRFRQSVLASAVSGKLTKEWRDANTFRLSVERYFETLHSFKVKAKNLDNVVNKSSWLACQLGHVVSLKSGYGLTAKKMNPSGEIPVYGGNGITGFHDVGNVSEAKVVIGRVGYYCGSVHLTEENAWVTDNALIVEFPEKLFIKDFVYWFLKATDLRADLSSSAQPVISGAKIYPINVEIPPIEEQQEIVRLVDQYFAFADTIEAQVKKAQARVDNLTQSILAKAFRGELVPQNEDDEPAEVLLERIAKARKEAEALAKAAKKAGKKKA